MMRDTSLKGESHIGAVVLDILMTDAFKIAGV